MFTKTTKLSTDNGMIFYFEVVARMQRTNKESAYEKVKKRKKIKIGNMSWNSK